MINAFSRVFNFSMKTLKQSQTYLYKFHTKFTTSQHTHKKEKRSRFTIIRKSNLSKPKTEENISGHLPFFLWASILSQKLAHHTIKVIRNLLE